MSEPWLYLFTGIGLLGLVSAVVAWVYIKADASDDDSTYGADEGAWPQ